MRLDIAVGHTLRVIRKERGLKLRQASSKTVCSLGHLSDVERGARQVSLQMLENLAVGYGISTSELLIRVATTIEQEQSNA
jgi:transcriptional regulator with XRE-family HTH domain